MTDATGRSFLSYRRSRDEEAALLIAAQHDHGIPTWQDVPDLAPVPTEDELRRILRDPFTANAVAFITPEVETSSVIRKVEIPLMIKRQEEGDGFFVLPVAAGGLDYEGAARVSDGHLTAATLREWNMQRIDAPKLSAEDAVRIARLVLVERVKALHRQLPPEAPVRLGLHTRGAPAIEAGVGLTLDWSARFTDKQADAAIWQNILLPALASVAAALKRHAPDRRGEAFGFPTMAAAVALGCAFLDPSGRPLTWRQSFPAGGPVQDWSLAAPREPSGFAARISGVNADGHDVAVLLSIADNVESLFAAYQRNLPPLRARVHVCRPNPAPHRLASPGEAADVASTLSEALRRVRHEYGEPRTIHLFLAAPVGVAVMVGQLLNTFGTVQTYDQVYGDDGTAYVPAARLTPMRG